MQRRDFHEVADSVILAGTNEVEKSGENPLGLRRKGIVVRVGLDFKSKEGKANGGREPHGELILLPVPCCQLSDV